MTLRPGKMSCNTSQTAYETDSRNCIDSSYKLSSAVDGIHTQQVWKSFNTFYNRHRVIEIKDTS